MSSQWERLLKNLGEWEGSFTRFSPEGELLEDLPSIVSLEGLNDNQKIRQVVRYLPEKEIILEYSSLNKSILFFEDGSFSQGSLQWGPFAEFGAEFGFIKDNRRLRIVQQFNTQGKVDRLTLIREKLAGTNSSQRPALSVDQLIGEWQGEAVTIYPDFRTPDIYPTHLHVYLEGSDRLVQKLTFSSNNSPYTITSSAKIMGSILLFEKEGNSSIQILLLPDGASANFPLKIEPNRPFFLEIGWLIEPKMRQRMIRSYSNKGEWISLSLVTETKIKYN
jgi:Domain of unknown function (DUF3598)